MSLVVCSRKCSRINIHGHDVVFVGWCRRQICVVLMVVLRSITVYGYLLRWSVRRSATACYVDDTSSF